MPSSTFLDGPYDGFQLVDWNGYRLGDEIEIPISAGLLDHLNGELTSHVKGLSGVAIYRVQLTKQGARFRFVRRRGIERHERAQMEAWQRQALERTTGNNCS
jgi:hypothetical protein